MGQVGSQVCFWLRGHEKTSRSSHQVELSPQSSSSSGHVAYALPAGPAALPVTTAAPAYAAAPLPVATAVAAPMAYALPTAAAAGVAPVEGVPMATGVAMAKPHGLVEGVPMAMGVGQTPAVAHGMPVMPDVQSRAQLPGKRKSLLIGINYFGTDAELGGCIADVKRMRPFLEQQGFPEDEDHQLVLLDEPGWPNRPTLHNMRRAIKWLTHDAKTGDALFFHYSGHGGRQEAAHAASGFVETLCPEDYDDAGELLDTELFESLVKPLPSGCRLTCLMDCCHSGGVLNLPYLFTGTKENLRQALSGQAVSLAMSKDWLSSLYQMKAGNPMAFLQDVSSMGLGLWGLYQQHQQASKAADESGFATDEQENVGLAVGEVLALTGCRSDQTSADVGNVQEQFRLRSRSSLTGRRSATGPAGGALTSVFMESLQESGELSYLSLMERIRGRLEEEDFEQVPQLATSLLIELNQPFSLTTISLPPRPGARSVGGGSCGGSSGSGDGLAAGVGGGALLAGFMASMAAAPGGQSMLLNARSTDGGMPFADLGNVGFGAEQLFKSFQDEAGVLSSMNWQSAAENHVKRLSQSSSPEVRDRSLQGDGEKEEAAPEPKAPSAMETVPEKEPDKAGQEDEDVKSEDPADSEAEGTDEEHEETEEVEDKEVEDEEEEPEEEEAEEEAEETEVEEEVEEDDDDSEEDEEDEED